MSDTLHKDIVIDESNPNAAEDHHDPPGSFLDVYRSLSLAHLVMDEMFVDNAVRQKVIPESVRYGIMQRGNLHAYRGVVKSVTGDLYYFNWHDGADFKLVPADNPTKVWDAERWYKSCSIGCDLRKAEVVDEEDEEADKGVATAAANATVSEDQNIKQQHALMTDVHPGAARGPTPDDPTVGRDWHTQPVTKAADAIGPVDPSGDTHWSTANLVKAWGRKLQQTAPSTRPQYSPLERQYLRDVLGVTDDRINKGFRMTPRHQVAFQEWKTSQLRGTMSGLQDWLSRRK